MSKNDLSPAEALDKYDPGDELQRNIRYQNACAVIILIETYVGNHQYSSVWCEHHDDILGERLDGLFDFYQIKTRKPENGYWQSNDEEVKNSLKKFVSHSTKFPAKVGKFYFVSNADYLKSGAKDKIGKSPIKLIESVILEKESKTPICEKLTKRIIDLSTFCECSIDKLKEVLLNTQFIHSPERLSYQDVISHTFLPQIGLCRSLTPSELNALRDELIHAVSTASSLTVENSEQHWYCVHGDFSTNPFLKAKRISLESFEILIQKHQSVPLRFSKVVKNYNLKESTNNVSKLEKKFQYAGLNEQLETMQNRMLAAELKLLELANRDPESYEEKANQITALVKGECDDSSLASKLSNPPQRENMLREVLNRLKGISEKRPQMVYNQEYEFLVGIAGILTNECAVWWSEKFDLESI
jgi:Cap4 dsDNA endonuclease